MEENAAKGLCLSLLFIDTLLFGWPPYLLVRGQNHSARSLHIRTTIISYLSCFGGGVFFGACLLHLLAEGREVMQEYFEKIDRDIDFPVYEAIVAAGFFAIAFVEQIAHSLLHKSHQGHQHLDQKMAKSRQDVGNSSLEGRVQLEPVHQVGPENQAIHQEMETHANLTEPLSNQDTKQKQGLKNGHTIAVASRSNVITYKRTPNDTLAKEEMNTIVAISYSNATSVNRSQNSLDHGHIHKDEDPKSDHDHGDEVVQMIKTMEVNPLRAFLLLGALSFHTIFDGLAVGLQHEHKHIWEMFTAICIHKSLVAVCLGLQLFLAFRSKPIMGFIWVFVFSLISPIGVGIGMALSSGHINELAEDLINWILQGMATGTFLYVTIFEILHEELGKNGGILKILVTMVGFGGMALAKYFDQD